MMAIGSRVVAAYVVATTVVVACVGVLSPKNVSMYFFDDPKRLRSTSARRCPHTPGFRTLIII